MIKRLKKAVAIVCAMLLLYPPYSVDAKVQTDLLRIGLITEFSQKSSLKLADSSITIGYSVTSDYKEVATINSTTGFQFQATTKYYAKSTNTYSTYEQAKTMATTLKKNYSVNAFVGLFSNGDIRVMIGESASENALKTVISKVGNAFGLTFKSVGADNGHRVKMIGSQDEILYDGSGTNGYPQIAPVTSQKDGAKVLTIGDKQYRGRMEIGRYGKTGVSAVNVVSVDDYLYGVIPAEMPASWHEEALKTQAVVARTYAVNKGGFASDSNATSPYILNDTTASQVYKGYQREENSTNQAVDATKGEYIYYDDKLIDATFFSTSGGATANSEDVWSGVVPYLRGVSDIYELEPEKEPWILSYTSSEIQSKLKAKGQDVGTVTNVIEDMRTDSNYLYSLKVQGKTKSITLQKSIIRSYFNTPSNKFKVITAKDTPDQVSVLSANGKESKKRIQNCSILSASGTIKGSETTKEQFIVMGKDNLSNYPKKAPASGTYYFAGMGYGHGVGMSQSGAKGMAKAGYTYKEIIEHYYTGAKVLKNS